MPNLPITSLPDLGFNKVVDQIAAERDAPKTMTLIVSVVATKEVIEQFASIAKSARGELTEMGFALRDLANCSRSGQVQLALRSETYTPFDFK